jgi:hypothetical protein
VSRLLAKARDGENGRNGTENLAGVPHQPARDIDGNDRQFPLGGGSERFRRRSLQRTAQARAENSIDDKRRAIQCRGRQGLDIAWPKARMMCSSCDSATTTAPLFACGWVTPR